MVHFIHVLAHYLKEILPALAVGFFISGIVHEFIPEDLVEKHLGGKGLKPILWSTLIGAILPVCCWGSLPIAVSFYKKGAKLGPVLAFLVATPATSISALLVTYSLLGFDFAAFVFFAVIIMGVAIGIIGNFVKVKDGRSADAGKCPHCEDGCHTKKGHPEKEKSAYERTRSILGYAFIRLPKEIGLEIMGGLVLAAVVATFIPIGEVIHKYLAGWHGYAFSVVFSLVTYICATASVPFVDSLINQGLDKGAGMTMLLIGPVTSYGTLLVLRKEFGMKVLAIFLAVLCILTVLLGFIYGYLARI